MLDFAGSGVVHVTGGTTAIIATTLLGPRKGRFHDERGKKLEKPKEFSGHSKSLQVGPPSQLCILSIAYLLTLFFCV